MKPTTTGKRLEESNDFRIPSDEEFWLALQRLLSFEEPSRKWSQIRKAIKKQLKRGGDTLSAEHQGAIFSQIFGDLRSQPEAERHICPDDEERIESLDQVVGICLAAEDLKRFSRLAFDSWAKERQQAGESSKRSGKSEGKNEARKWLQSFCPGAPGDQALSASESLWLAEAGRTVGGWSRLHQPGPWDLDRRAEFILDFMLRAKETLASDEGRSPDGAAGPGSIDSLYGLWSELLIERRPYLPGDFLPQMMLLAEGATETVLIPAFAERLGFDLSANGVDVIACGGARQVAKTYLTMRDLTVLPIVVLLDADVDEEAELLQDSLRASDRLVILEGGEIEDIFAEDAFRRYINLYLAELGCTDLLVGQPPRTRESRRVPVLDRIWKARGLGSFDKIGFAEVVAKNMVAQDVPQEARRLVKTLSEVANGGISLRFEQPGRS